MTTLHCDYCEWSGAESNLTDDGEGSALCPACGERVATASEREVAAIALAEYRAGIPQALRLMREHRICNGDDLIRVMERGE